MAKDEEERQAEPMEPWKLVVELVREAYSSGKMPTRLTQAICVLIPKNDKGEYRGIGLLEAMWKLITSIANRRMARDITLHDAHHGFRARRGTGTAILETKLRMQLARRQGWPYYQVFIDLSKAYDTIDRTRMEQILQAYGVGPRMLRILRQFWDNHQVVTKQATFFGKPFKATRGVTQGDIISPMLFNIAVDAVIRAWERDMKAWRIGHGKEGDGPLDMDCEFYADDGKIGSTDAPSVQQATIIMVELFKSLGLKANAQKTKGMITRGYVDTIKQSIQAYNRRMTGEGQSYKERGATQVCCPICGDNLQQRSMKNHLKFKHGGEPVPTEERDTSLEEVEAEGIFTCNMSKEYNARAPCPVPGCKATIARRDGMRKHFLYRHPRASVQFPGEKPLEPCPECTMQVPNVERHKGSENCKKARARETKRVQEEANKAAAQTIFNINGQPIEIVSEFKYLGRILAHDDDDWPAIRTNIKKARMRWGQVARILSREEATSGTMAYFYKAIVQAVLLYGSESWVLTERMRKALNSFHHRCARYIAGEHIRQLPDGEWIHPPTADILDKCKLRTIDEYIERRKRTVSAFIRNRSIYGACLASIPSAGNTNQKLWWDRSRV